MTAPISSALRRVRFWHVIALLIAATAVLFVAVPKVGAVVSSVEAPVIVDAKTGTATDYTFVFVTGVALDNATDNEEIRIILPDNTAISGSLVDTDILISSSAGGSATKPDSVVVSSQEIRLGVPDASDIGAGETVTVVFSNTA